MAAHALGQTPIHIVFRRFREPEEPTDLCCRGLVGVVEAWRLEDVLPGLIAVEEAVDSGLYAAGLIAYEAAAAMDAAARTRPPGPLPLLWFGLFREMVSQLVPPAGPAGDFSVRPWRPSIPESQYHAAIDRIKNYIARGHTYQVNYTYRLRSEFAGDPWAFFQRLCDAQRGAHGAFLDMGRHVVCSASPELFFRLDGDLLTARPMKGTAPRGLTLEEDRRRAAALAGSAKDRAENAMIVDMMRNDLGRIARRGSVRVAAAFAVEKYPTLLQMTSTVTARSEAPLAEILQAVFPPASITGAPKLRTMEIIRELEPDPRGVYTGCIGYLAPGRQASFNVAIRTVCIDRATGAAEYGVGGGIVWDSSDAGEYAECRTKAAVLTAEFPRFELLETLLWDGRDGYFLLEGHLRRLADSAEYFAFALDLDAVRRRLEEFGTALADGRHRVRLCVNRQGAATLESAPLALPQARLGLSAAARRSADGSLQPVPLSQDDAPRLLSRRPAAR